MPVSVIQRPTVHRLVAYLLACSVVGSLACRDLVGNATLPAGTQGPDTYNTPSGAIGMYQGVKVKLRNALAGSSGFLITSGVLTDELTEIALGTGPLSIGAQGGQLDERIQPEKINSDNNSEMYDNLQKVRGGAAQAIGLLATYAPKTSPALRGEMYALAGYSELLLAELYCSGVPLSTLDFHGDFTYQPSSTETQVYQHAITLFDSALAISSDSPSVIAFARVAKGRALLDLGAYAQAAQAVTAVPDAFQFQDTLLIDLSPSSDTTFFGYTVANREGQNGLPFSSQNDPRAKVVATTVNLFGLPLFVPAKYPRGTRSPLILASGIEARLIEAEAALNAGDARWLTILNTLRTNGAGTAVPPDTIIDTLGVTGCNANQICGGNGPEGSTPIFGQPAGGFPGYTPVSGDTILNAHTITAPDGGNIQDYCYNYSWYVPCYSGDTMVVLTYVRPASTQWNAGTGGVAGLAPLTDPGTGLSGTAATNVRIDLLFRERAFWMFLTGHRQGDLRRLVRNYGRPQTTVYPTGPYYGGNGVYGDDVTIPIPGNERSNPRFHGCLDRGA